MDNSAPMYALVAAYALTIVGACGHLSRIDELSHASGATLTFTMLLEQMKLP